MSRRHVALLRGINVGKAKRIAMADLRGLVESLGYTDVQTLLNSGNVVFTAPAAVRGNPAARIERGLADALGVTSRVTVLTAAELAAIVEANPLVGVADNPSRLMVAFLNDPADTAKLAPLVTKRWAPEAMALGPRVAYFWCPEGVVDSAVAKAIGQTLGDAVTTRNWATTQKLQALTDTPTAPVPARGRARAPRPKDQS